MKNFGKLFLAACLAMGLAACANEEGPAQAEQLPNPDGVYMTLKVQMPMATRSATDGEVGDTPSDADMEQENASAAENALKTVQLVLVEPDGNNIVAISEVAEATKFGKVPGISGAGNNCLVKFKSADLVNYASESEEKKLHIYAFCNATYTGNKGTMFNTNLVLEAGAGQLWSTEKGFAMTNQEFATATLPIAETVKKATDPAHPLVLGSIKVERVAARFDINKDKTQFDVIVPVKKTDVSGHETIENQKQVKIVLDRFGMYNVADKAYAFRRTSSLNGFLGKELTNNYIVDCPHGFTQLQPDWKTWADLTQVDDEGWKLDGADPNPEYYVYRYAVENTFNSEEKAVKEEATAIAFEGHLEAGADCPKSLKDALAAKKDNLYVLNPDKKQDILYGTWERLEKGLKKPVGELRPGEEDFYIKDESVRALIAVAMDFLKADKSERPLADKQKEAAIRAGFKVLYPTEVNGKKQYHVYYDYWNKHNDDGVASTEGIMEYGVVRNNVYKLKVSGITGFGNPEWKRQQGQIITEDVYFQVTVNIQPWTVRVNDIELGEN